MFSLAVALALAGCGGSRTALEETAANLEDIRSGELRIEASITPEGSGEAFAYELSGPFRFPEGEGVAAAKLRYRQTLGDESEEAVLFSDGDEGWIELDGNRKELSDEQLEALVIRESDEDGFLGDLDLEEWFVDPETDTSAGDTITISGTARVSRTLEGLMGLAGGLGRSGPLDLEEDDEERLDRIAKGSRLEVVTGVEDHLLRRLRYELDLGLDVTPELRAALGNLDGARLVFDLEIRSPNEPVEITA